jgi:hypothetical protein
LVSVAGLLGEKLEDDEFYVTGVEHSFAPAAVAAAPASVPAFAFEASFMAAPAAFVFSTASVPLVASFRDSKYMYVHYSPLLKTYLAIYLI